jgi:REP element-mobilizing transposase RayT
MNYIKKERFIMQKLFCGVLFLEKFNEKTAHYCVATTQEEARQAVKDYQQTLKFSSEIVDVVEISSLINGFQISLSTFEEPTTHMENMLLYANDTKERLFSIIVTHNNEDHIYQTVALDSQEAFKQARKDFNDENLYDMKASIVRFLSSYKVNLQKVS